MTRTARGNVSTHQKVAHEPTPWEELKATPEKSSKRKINNSESNDLPKKSKKRKFKEEAKYKKDPVNAVQIQEESEPIDDEVPVANNSLDDNAPATAESLTGPTENATKKPKKVRKSKNVKGEGEGKVVKIFGSFWVPADDARRLQGLVKKLKSQGLTRSQIFDALKNERRRAEKAAKRQRDKTCFGCRQFGHVLRECPNAKVAEGAEEETGEQICFKCGSTEHTSRSCKRKGDKFNFAKCFICSGTGHIARQCPKNSKGIYPQGGACSVCNDNTHLSKDCPNFVVSDANATELGESKIQIPTLAKGEIAIPRLSDPKASSEYDPDIGNDFESESTTIDNSKHNRKKNKKVKF